MSKNKTAIALILMFAMAISLFALPDANAQGTQQTYPIIGAVPNPVGVNQQTLIMLGLTHETAHPHEGWTGLSVTITKPDGVIETISGIKTDTTGMTGVTYTPTMAGTYYLQANFPEQKILATAAGTPNGTTMLASTSDKLALVVTEEPRQYYPGVPLPTEYWTRPIDAQAREWSVIAGNWPDLPANMFAIGNDDAPETAHILWAKPLAEGGLVGADLDEMGYEHGDAYEGKWSGSIILNGVLFFNRQAAQSLPTAPGMTPLSYTTVEQKVVAVDLKTGEELWSKVLGNNERLAFGQIMYWETMDMYGAFSYLWTTVGSTWNAYDPFTGRWEYTIKNVPSGVRLPGPNGEILIHTVNLANGWMTQWNSTSVVYKSYLQLYLNSPDSNTVASAYYYAQRWRPHGITFDSNSPFNVTAQWIPGFPSSATTVGIDWNVTIPKGLPERVNTVLEDRILGGNIINVYGGISPDPIILWGISIAPGHEGELLFNTTWKTPPGNLTIGYPCTTYYPPDLGSLDDGVFIVASKETRQYWGFSTDTGKQLWGPTEPEPYLNAYTVLYRKWGNAYAYGKFFTAGMAGVVNAYNVTTGEKLWTYNVTDTYTEQLFSENWPVAISIIADGKLYLFHGEHSANQPLPRGAPTVCLNATTGEEIWRIDGLRLNPRHGGSPIIGDDTIVGLNTYDNRIVAIGKGPSATTVEAGPEISVHGTNVVVKGMVTDVSPGTNDGVLSMRFPNGVPAVSDANMSDWMLYVYQQFDRPADVVGVDMVVSVLDPNNNYYEVARTTSDASGYFGCTFEPEVPGFYKIIATFEGSGAYYGSFAETFVNVEGAPEATPEPTPPPATMTDTYLLGSTIAVIVAIAIVAILMLRKR